MFFQEHTAFCLELNGLELAFESNILLYLFIITFFLKSHYPQRISNDNSYFLSAKTVHVLNLQRGQQK